MLEEILKEADETNAGELLNEKNQKIVEIKNKGKEVLHFIVRHGLTSNEQVLEIEATFIDFCNHLFPQQQTNLQRGHGKERGMKRTDELLAELNATSIYPSKALPYVFLFPIQRAFATTEERRYNSADVYEATRAAWGVAKHWREIPGAIAIGLDGELARGAFEISAWHEWSQDSTKYEFDGRPIPGFESTNWRTILSKSGYWQFGNYLVVEFDGNGQFRFLRGNTDKSTWFPLG